MLTIPSFGRGKVIGSEEQHSGRAKVHPQSTVFFWLFEAIALHLLPHSLSYPVLAIGLSQNVSLKVWGEPKRQRACVGRALAFVGKD